jgi:hypothetical protein
MMMLDHTKMNAYVSDDGFPGPICLLLTLIENFTIGGMVPDPIEGRLVIFKNGK